MTPSVTSVESSEQFWRKIRQIWRICEPCIVFSFSWELKWPQEKLKTMLMQNLGVTKKEHYGRLWYFLEWSIVEMSNFSLQDKTKISDK